MSYLDILKQYVTPEQLVQYTALAQDPNALTKLLSGQNLVTESPTMLPNGNLQQQSSSNHNSKHIEDAIAQQGLLLDMFGEFCLAQPQSAKEMSNSFTKFARWMQSEADKKLAIKAA